MRFTFINFIPLFYFYSQQFISLLALLESPFSFLFLFTFCFVFILIKNVAKEICARNRAATSCTQCVTLLELLLLLLSLHVARVASLQDDYACSTCFSAATLHATNTTRQRRGSEMIDDVAKY